VIDLALAGNWLQFDFASNGCCRHDVMWGSFRSAQESAADAVAASGAVSESCAAGTLSPGEAAEVMRSIETHLRAIELRQIEAGMAALEKSQKGAQP
jgi:hypothetical protein